MAYVYMTKIMTIMGSLVVYAFIKPIHQDHDNNMFHGSGCAWTDDQLLCICVPAKQYGSWVSLYEQDHDWLWMRVDP